jgi:hypothetical protein|tara:strand:+ start:472 stop:723 length:252 start_codon:yes stop_codon:yes gene_type:complete
MVKETLMLLSTQIEKRRKEMLEVMGRGTDKFEAYQHACGEIRGYMMVQTMISEAIQANEKGEEDFNSTPTDSVVQIDSKRGKK